MALAEYLVELPQDLWLTVQLDNPASLPNPSTPPVAMATPTVTTLAPNTAAHGTGELIVQVTGTGFTEISKVLWNGALVNTAFIGGTALRIRVIPKTAGVFPVSVVTGSKKSGTTNFTVT